MNSNCSNLLHLRNLQEQVKKAFCYQKLFWPFTVWINCSSDLKIFANSWPSASNFKSFSWSLEQFFLTVGQNNFGNKIPGPQNTIFTHTYLPSLRYTYFAIFSLNQDVRSKSVKSLLLFWWATDIGFCFTLENNLVSLTKVQLILKGSFEVFIWTKKRTKIFL